MNREEELVFLIENKRRMVTILESELNDHQNELDDLRLDEEEKNFRKIVNIIIKGKKNEPKTK